ncbi:zinc finger protein 43-like [Anopheles aquasalis]|uniref:zinc finger protein 43-like n=1 Tax=Anopheles aquasalis TaxID=42839 RepID=UPI00215AA300|nr:zinc finger protein 43-like [Anopheles aquasalis]XP_050087553.1 zinc finger protein 43-like [Anopheles aquasalis]
MVKSECCALCLSNESEWLLELFGDDIQAKDRLLVISKHLWFDLKSRNEETYVCSECWKSVHDFDLFYCKLEKIHRDLQEHDDDDEQSGVTTPLPQPDFEFHPVLEIKIEPSDGPDNDVGAVSPSEEIEILEEHELVSPNTTVEEPEEEEKGLTTKVDRPRRSHSTSAKMKYESSISEWDGVEQDYLADDDYIEEEVIDEDADGDGDEDEEVLDEEEDDEDYINYDELHGDKEQASGKNQSSMKSEQEGSDALSQDVLDVETPKRKRGRPPKRKPEDSLEEPGPSRGDSTRKSGRVKNRRKSTKSISQFSDSDSDILSDPDDSPRSRARNKKIGNRKALDQKIFSYIDEFFCYYCPDKVLFERFHHANLHYKELHNEPAFLRCPKCGKKCFTPGGFLSHMETHDDPEKNKCPICGKVTDQRITLKKHMRAHQQKLEEALPYPCSQCPRRFDQQKVRDKHERLHGRKIVIRKEKGRDLELLAFYKRIYCEICEEAKPNSTSFDNFWDLKVHMGNEHNKNPYLKCHLCLAKLPCRQQLMVHVDVHNNPENYRCEVCSEIHQNLEKHMIKAHTPETSVPQEKNYSCEHCGKMFKCETNLKNHIDRVHGVKDVCCDICNKSFNRKALGAHKRSAHSDEMYMCEHCPKMFKTRSGLESHKGEHDANLRKSVKCTLCGKEMRRGASMAKHMKTIHSQEDPVSCNLCGKVFRTSFHMLRHRQNTCAATINSRPYKCEVCGKGFAMKLTMTEHMTTHTRTSLYQCAFCFKTFGYISNLYKHRKKAHPVEWQEVQARPEDGIATVIEIRN